MRGALLTRYEGGLNIEARSRFKLEPSGRGFNPCLEVIRHFSDRLHAIQRVAHAAYQIRFAPSVHSWEKEPEMNIEWPSHTFERLCYFRLPVDLVNLIAPSRLISTTAPSVTKANSRPGSAAVIVTSRRQRHGPKRLC